MSKPLETKTVEEAIETLIDYRGKTPPKTTEGVWLITAKVIKDGFVQKDNKEFIAADFYDEWMRRGLPRQWDVLVTTEAPLGEVAQLRTPERIALAQRVILLRSNPKVLDQGFLYQAMKSPFVQGELKSRSSGTTVLGIKQSELWKVRLPWFPLPVQRKIAGILSAYDDLIENNTRRIAILEEMAQTIYREWFVHFRFPGHENATFVNSPQGRIPEGWMTAKLKDICESVSYGYTASANKDAEVGPKLLRITDIVPPVIDWENVPYCEIDADIIHKYSLHEGHVVIARTGATTGFAKRIHKRHPTSVFASYLVRLVPKTFVGKHYVGMIAESAEYKDFIKRNVGGSAQPQANAQVLTSLHLLVPPTAVIFSFDEVIEPLADQREILQEKNRLLRKTRDLLLPKLLSGQLDVEQLDIDMGDALRESVA